MLVGASVIALPDNAVAQVAPTREEITRPSPTPVQPPRSQLVVEGGIERAPCALDNPEFKDIRFGYGRENGLEVMHFYTQVKSVWVDLS